MVGSIIPRFTGAGLLDYGGMALGLIVGFALSNNRWMLLEMPSRRTEVI